MLPKQNQKQLPKSVQDTSKQSAIDVLMQRPQGMVSTVNSCGPTGSPAKKKKEILESKNKMKSQPLEENNKIKTTEDMEIEEEEAPAETLEKADEYSTKPKSVDFGLVRTLQERSLAATNAQRGKASYASVVVQQTLTDLFLSVDLQHYGINANRWCASYMKENKEEAEGTWRYLAKYFECQFGSESLVHFSQSAIEEAHKMGWDEASKQLPHQLR